MYNRSTEVLSNTRSSTASGPARRRILARKIEVVYTHVLLCRAIMWLKMVERHMERGMSSSLS